MPYTNYIMQKKIKIEKNIRNQILKHLNYKYLLTKKINLNLFFKSDKLCKKPKIYICFLPCVISSS